MLQNVAYEAPNNRNKNSKKELTSTVTEKLKDLIEIRKLEKRETTKLFCSTNF